MNNFLSDIFYILLLLERYHQICQAVLAATGMNRLIGGIQLFCKSLDSASAWCTLQRNMVYITKMGKRSL